MKEFEDILLEKFNLKTLPKHLNNHLCVVGQNNNLLCAVSAPGHVDAEKWVVRFAPLVTHKGFHFALGAFLEERFDSRYECAKYLTINRENIYKELFYYICSELEKNVTEEYLAEKDSVTYELFTQEVL